MERARPRSHVLAGFRQKIAASVTIAALATAGLIAGISRLAPSLPVLQFASATSQPSNSFIVSTNYEGTSASTSFIGTPHTIVAGPGLSTFSSSALVYQETAPRDPEAVTKRIAQAFGIVGAIKKGSRHGTWVVRNTTLTLTTSLRGTSELDWSVTDTHPCFSVSCRKVLLGGQFTKIRDIAILANARSILSNVKSTIPLSSLHRKPSSNDKTTITGSLDSIAEHITYDQFENIVDAQGVVTTLSELGNYPTLSASAGLKELLDQGPGALGPNLSSLSKSTEIVNVDRVTYRPATVVSGERILLPYYTYFVDGHSIGAVASVVPTYLRG